MQAKLISVANLHPNTGQVDGLPKNPRFIKDDKFEKLKKSIQTDPEMMDLREVIAYDNNGELVVICGNMRLRAAQELGLKEVPVKVLPSTTPIDKLKAYVIKDNVPYGEHDFDALANDFDLKWLEELGMDIPGMDKLMQSEAGDDGYEIPDKVQTDIAAGDLFEIGPHKLLCGSATDPENWKRLFGDERADIVITDPPYNVNYTGKTKDALKIENDKKSNDDFYQFLFAFYSALAPMVKNGGAWYVWHADTEGANFRLAMQHAGIMVKQCLVWVKNTMVMGRQDYHWKHEPCLYGWKEGAAHTWHSDRKQTTVLEFERPTRNVEHPTMKPIPLIGYQMGNSSKEGDLVADAFLGSGTTMVAAHKLGRKCYGTELDAKYCAVILNRMSILDPTLTILKNGEAYHPQGLNG